jgi:hypothetical protein
MNCLLLTAVLLAAIPLDRGNGETAVHLTVRPMPAPRPALKYQLLPEVRELNPGNAAHNYLKCFAEQRTFFFSKHAVAERARYRSMPIAKLPAEDLRDYGRFALRQADWAARLSTIDWQLVQHTHSDSPNLLQSEVGRFQVLAEALQVRFRAQAAGRHFGDAVRTAKTMFALARHLGEYPREAANLVGLSIADMALATLEEMVQQPGCPNLYWALTDLPSPLVDLHKGLQGERARMAAELSLLRTDAPMNQEQLEDLVSHLSGISGYARVQEGQTPRNLRAMLAKRIKDPERVAASRQRLIEGSCAEDLVETFPSVQAVLRDLLPTWFGRSRSVEKFPPLQVILLDEKREYEARWDECLKFLALAPWQIDACAGSDESVCCEDEEVFAGLLPPIRDARRLQARLEQRIALLRHVEALRLYAAAHHGRLPEKLADLPVPFPADLFTGKPFLYTVDGETAQLRGCPPRGEERNPCFNARYEVRMASGEALSPR